MATISISRNLDTVSTPRSVLLACINRAASNVSFDVDVVEAMQNDEFESSDEQTEWRDALQAELNRL